MAIDFNDPNTVNALSMALGMVGQLFAQNPQQANFANQATQLARSQQRSQLLGNLLRQGGNTPQVGQTQAGYASKLTPEEIDQAPTATAQGLQQPTTAAQGGLSTMDAGARYNLLSQLLGGGQTPFGSTQRR